MLSTRKQNNELLVYGYLNKNERMYRFIIPRIIYHLILSYSETLEFHYNGGNESVFIITDEGQTVSLKKEKYGTLIYGDFLHAKQRCISTLFVKVHKSSGLYYGGYGFCTPEFVEFVTSTYNNGKNHSTTLNISGYYKSSEEFGSTYKHCADIAALSQWCQPGEIAAIQIDMDNTKIGRIWNYTQNKSYENNIHVFEVKLPNEVAFVIYGGAVGQTYSVVQM